MATYGDVSKAYAAYCDVGLKLRNEAYSLAREILEALKQCEGVGERIGPFPPEAEKVEPNRKYTVQEACRHRPDEGEWEFTTVFRLDRPGNDTFGQFLRLLFTVRPDGEVYTIGLDKSDVSVTINPREMEDAKAQIGRFAYQVLDAIVEFFDSSAKEWVNHEDASKGVIGFHTGM